MIDKLLDFFNGNREEAQNYYDNLMSYFNHDELAGSVWFDKYRMGDESTPDDMHQRLAKEFARVIWARAEEIKLVDTNKLSKFGKKFFEDMLEHGHYTLYTTIYNLLKDFKHIVPQGSVMSQLGGQSIGSLSNCFVIGMPEDSYGGIFQKDEEMVQLMKRRGGVGIDLSSLRPKETAVSNAAQTTTGAVSFMHRYSNSTREVAQNGRRGALMLSISINHPDVLEFIRIKRDLTQVTGANISVKLDSDFMYAVEEDLDYMLRFPCDDKTHYRQLEMQEYEYDKLYTLGAGYVKRIRAKEYWEEIIKSAHNVAEPGIIFEDNHHYYSPDGVYSQFKGVTTNPCGEIFMQPYDACRLIAINLLSSVTSPYMADAEFDTDLFFEVTYIAMVMSDALIDLELEHIDRILNKIKKDVESLDVKSREFKLWEKVKATAMASRRTGLGFTALGDCMAALNIKYDSEEGLLFTEQFMHLGMEAQLEATIDMAVLRGPFEGWDVEKEFPTSEDENILYGNGFYYNLQVRFPEQAARMKKFGRRNVSWNTVAPTGSVSILTQTTSGLEPIFQPFYMRRKKVNPGSNVRVDFTDQNGDTWQEYPVLHHEFKNWCIRRLPELDTYFWGKDIDSLTKEDLQKAFELSPWFGATANDIDWKKRVEIQAIIQKYTTHSISSTINLPETVTEQEVSEIYLHSWKQGLKGVTVYRDGSRSGVLITEKKPELVTFNENHAPKRPKSLPCKIIRFNNNYEKWIAFVGMMDNKPYEVFTGKADTVDLPISIEVGEIKKIKDGDKRYDFIYDGGVIENISKVSSENYWNYGKLISGMLRHGMPLQFVVDTIQNLTWDHDNINTWKNGMARALKKFIKDGKVEGIKCQECDSENIIFEEGCSRCLDCGSSKCG